MDDCRSLDQKRSLFADQGELLGGEVRGNFHMGNCQFQLSQIEILVSLRVLGKVSKGDWHEVAL